MLSYFLLLHKQDFQECLPTQNVESYNKSPQKIIEKIFPILAHLVFQPKHTRWFVIT